MPPTAPRAEPAAQRRTPDGWRFAHVTLVVRYLSGEWLLHEGDQS